MGTKHFTSLTFAEIYDKDVLVPKFQRSMIVKSEGDTATYNRGFWHFKHSYRGRYSPKFLERYGFKPIGTGTQKKIKLDEYLDFIKHNYDSSAHNITSTETEVGLLDNQVKFYLEKNNYNWSSYKHELIMPYSGSNKDSLCCSGGIGVLYPTCCEPPPEDEEDTCGDITCSVIYNIMDVEYANLNNDPNVPDDLSRIKATFRNINNPSIEPFVIEINNDFPNTAIYTTYRHSSGDEWYYFIKDRASSNFLYETILKMFSAIIPIKEWGQLHLEEKNIKKMLKKYSLAPDDLMESFSKLDDDGEPEIDNAYLMTGLCMKDPYVVEEIGTFDAKDVEHLSTKFLARCQRSEDGEKYTITQENVDWWKDKNKLRRRKYARMAYDIIKYYDNGSTEITMNAAKMTYEIDFILKGKNGVLPDAIRSDGSINIRFADFERKTVIIQRPYEYFRPCGKKQTWSASQTAAERREHSSCMRKHGWKYGGTDYDYDYGGNYMDSILNGLGQNDRDDMCSFKHTDDEIEAIAGGGTLPVKCPAIVIRRQISELVYNELIVTKLNQFIWISGHWFKLKMDGSWRSDSSNAKKQTLNRGEAGDKYPRLVYPLDLLNGLDFMSYVIAKEYGTIFMVYTIKTVKTKWWQKFIGIIFAIIVCVAFTAGCGIVNALINIAISYAVQFVVSLVLEAIDSPLLRAIVQIAVVLVSAYFGGINSLDKLAENFLPLATDISSIVMNTYTEIKMRELQEMREHQENLDAATRIAEGIEEGEAPILTVAPMDKSVHTGFMAANSPEAFYAKSLESLFNFDIFFDSGASIEMRSQVVSG